MNNLLILEVEMDAMAPVIMEGDEIGVDVAVIPEANGKDLTVMEIAGTYHVCRYTRFGSQILMLHDNGPIAVVNEADARIVGTVVAIEGMQDNEKSLLLAQ